MTHEQAANLVAFPRTSEIDDVLAQLDATRVDSIVVPGWTLDFNGWDKCRERLAASRFAVRSLIAPSFLTLPDRSKWPTEQQRLRDVVDMCVALDCPRFYGTTGPRGDLYFDEATDRLTEGLVPVLDYAREQGVSVLLETTQPLRVDLHFVFSIPDLVEVCQRAGLGMCFDIGSCWTERDIERKLEELGSQASMVQLSDFVPGTVSSMERAVPGDGIVPLERIVAALARSGFSGLWDIELLGDRSQGESPAEALNRSWGVAVPMIDSALAAHS